MKKYDIALEKYCLLDKLKSKFNYQINVMSVFTALIWISYMVMCMIFGREFHSRFETIFLYSFAIGFLMFFVLRIVLGYKVNKFEKNNKDFLLYSRKDINEFIRMKNTGYDKFTVKEDIKAIVQEHKSDDNKLTDEFYQYTMTSKFRDKVTEYLKYCDMELHYDIEV